MAWIREGECNRCGQCCWGDPGDMTADVQGTIEGACPLLRCDNKSGLFECVGHGWHPYWEAGCKDWPGPHPFTLEHTQIKGCGFTYREVSGGR